MAKAEFAFGVTCTFPLPEWWWSNAVHTVEKHSANRMPFAIMRSVLRGQDTRDRLAGLANDGQSTKTEVGFCTQLILTDDEVEQIQYSLAMASTTVGLPLQKIGDNLYEFYDESGLFKVDRESEIIHFAQVRGAGSDIDIKDTVSVHASKVMQVIGTNGGDLWRNPRVSWNKE